MTSTYSKFSWAASFSSSLSWSVLSAEEVTDDAHVTDLNDLGDIALGGVSGVGGASPSVPVIPNPVNSKKKN